MTDNSLLEAQRAVDSLFPPAPEDGRASTSAKKRASKKAAAKKATKAKTKSSVEAEASSEKSAPVAVTTPVAAPVPVAAPTPVSAPAPAAESDAAPTAKKAKKASAKKASKKAAKGRTAAAESETTAAPTPEVQATLPLAAPTAPASVQSREKAVPKEQTTAPVPVQPASETPTQAQPQNATPQIASAPSGETAKSEAPAQQPQQQPQHQEAGEGGGQYEKRGRFRKWDKRNRFRDRKGGDQSEGGQRPEPPPERPLGPPEPTEGLLELTPKGYGFLRQKSRQYAPIPQDPWVSPEWIRNLGLREGMFIVGVQQEGHRGPQVTQITEVNGMAPEKVRDLPLFEELKAINPNKRIQLETRPDRLTTRVMDLITPVGRGQRGLIVAPPRAGKTTLLEHIAEAITEKHPDMHLMVLLIDERPEEVTQFRRALPNAEIHSSSNDNDVKSHMRTAVFAIERAKRLVEAGQHVFMLMDSITRMGRAFNNAQKGGAVMSGGVGVGALEVPRRLFAAARNTRDAGSLTILATTLIETNSRMDELIFQEFKGTGNLELVLDRKIAEQYIYPAVNIFRSGTRREELLLPAFQMEKIHMLRRGLAGHKPIDAVQRVISLLERSPSNTQMLIDLPGKVSV